jgi:transposase InsO family protein/transposase-like protein
MTPKSWRKGIIMIPDLKQRSLFIMRLTFEDRLKMCEDHMLRGKSLSHISEKNGNYDITNLKYLINLYKKFGSEVFLNRKDIVYYRDTKLLAISRVQSGKESLRSVALDLGLPDPTILGGWIKVYKAKGESGIQDTYPRKNYVLKDERARQIVDKKLAEENERLRAEIEYLKKSHSLTQRLEGVTSREKTKIVTALRKEFKLEVLLEVSGMASSVYYYHLTAENERIDKYKEIKEMIDYLYIDKHKKRMGYQRIHLELLNMGYHIGKNKVNELMREKGYLKIRKPKWHRYNSYEGDQGGIRVNEMNRDFTTIHPYQKAGTDVSLFSLDEESVYLSPIIDFDSREVLAYTAGQDAKMDKIMSMLKDLERTHGKRIKGMMVQSDQGVQYQNSRYREQLEKLGMIQSMSRKGNCLDNSPTENFFGRMKLEMWYGHEHEYNNVEELLAAIDEYIKYYNTTRIVSKLKMSPIDYRNTVINRI